jgi:hypothetical protein
VLYIAAAAAAAFNLICAGTTEKTDFNGSRSEPYSVTYRVDASAQKWCVDDEQACKTPEALVAIDAAYVKFIDTTTDTPREYFRYVDQVNRETGRHQSLMISGRGEWIRITKKEGECRRAPFSGFPKVNPKF